MKKDTDSDALKFFFSKLPLENDCRPMYHYTSPDGFLSIINSQKLWFTRYDCMNDYTEREYILDVLISVAEELKDSKEISRNLYNQIEKLQLNKKEVLFSYQRDESHLNPKDVEYYVCCFSHNRDSLPMWNYYSKENRYEGYNLEFSYDFFDFHMYKNQPIGIKMFDVIYDRSEQESRIKDEIIDLARGVKSPNAAKDIICKLVEFIKAYALAFKNPCFKHEEETRIILAVPNDGDSHFPIKYRISNGCVVPYVEFEFEKDKMTGVTIGPLINSKISESTVWQLLKQRGYMFDNIITSKIPIRF